LKLIFEFYNVRCLVFDSLFSVFFSIFKKNLIFLFGNFLVWVHFHPFYFLFASEGPFDGGYVFNDLGEHTF